MENFGEIFKIMQSEPANKMCIDCQRPYPLYASINNGVFICEQCSILHKEMGSQISFIRHLKDEWDEYLLTYMSRAGNSRFINVMNYYSIPNEDPLYKYTTTGIENYRLTLRSEVLAEEPPESIPQLEGNSPASNLVYNPYPEFQDYKLMEQSKVLSQEELEEVNLMGKKGFISKVGVFFKKVGKGVTEIAQRMSDKIKEYEIAEKIKMGGSKAYIVLKKAGGFVVLKSKPVVDKLTEKTIDGANIIKRKTQELYSDIKHKITGRGELSQQIELKEQGQIPSSDYYELKSNKTIDFINDNEGLPSTQEKQIECIQSNQSESHISGDINNYNALRGSVNSGFTLLNDTQYNINSYEGDVNESKVQSSYPSITEIKQSNEQKNNN